MARPLGFDRTEVLRKATELFNERGYTRTSTRDLVAATGLNESSLYNSFGNKRALFVEVLTAYDSQLWTSVVENKDGRSARENIEYLFTTLIDHVSYPHGQGCMLLTAANELGQGDEEIRNYTVSAYQKITEGFESLLQQGQTDGDVSSKKTPAQLALFFTNAYQGLRSGAALEPSHEACEDVISVAFAVLDD